MNKTRINNIITESINKVINEKNYMINANASDIFSNIDKAQKHVKAAINCFRKAGQFDELRGNSNSSYAEIMSLLSKANSVIDRYYWETSEGDEHGVFDNKTANDFKVSQVIKKNNIKK